MKSIGQTKLVEQVINPYVVAKRNELRLPANQRALSVWDVFKGQTTDRANQLLDSLNIEVVTVPANMTHFFNHLTWQSTARQKTL